MRKLIFNTRKAPYRVGQIVIPPLNYVAVPEDQLDPFRGNSDLKIEGQPGFPELWLRYGEGQS